ADPGRGAALGRRGLEGIGRAVIGDPVAALRHVAGARRRATDRRALRICRAGGTRPRAGLRDVARSGRRTTHGARVPGGVLARRTGAVALVERAGVAVVGARGPGRRVRIGRAIGPGAGAGLLRIALPRGRTAHHGRGLEAVGGTGRGGAGAGLRDVTEARRGPADGPGVAGRVRARGGAGGAVAHVGGADVAVIRAGRPRRLDGVGRAGGARPHAGLGEVALVDRRPAHRAGGREPVGGADAARAGAGLGHVADIRGSAALSARGLERAVDVAAGAARPVVRAVIALLGALDAAVPAAGRVGGDGRRPGARGPQRAMGGRGARRHRGAEVGLEGQL